MRLKNVKNPFVCDFINHFLVRNASLSYKAFELTAKLVWVTWGVYLYFILETVCSAIQCTVKTALKAIKSLWPLSAEKVSGLTTLSNAGKHSASINRDRIDSASLTTNRAPKEIAILNQRFCQSAWPFLYGLHSSCCPLLIGKFLQCTELPAFAIIMVFSAYLRLTCWRFTLKCSILCLISFLFDALEATNPSKRVKFLPDKSPWLANRRRHEYKSSSCCSSNFPLKVFLIDFTTDSSSSFSNSLATYLNSWSKSGGMSWTYTVILLWGDAIFAVFVSLYRKWSFRQWRDFELKFKALNLCRNT